MRGYLVVIFVLFFSSSIFSEVINISDNQSVSIDVVGDWEMKPMMSPPGMPVKTIHLIRDGSKIMLTLFGSKDGSKIEKSMQELIAITKETSGQYVATSVEGDIKLNPVSESNIYGSYASFTDREWVGKDVPRGTYSCVTSGVFLANGVMVAATYLSKDIKSETFNEGLAIIKSIGKKVSGPK